MRRWAYNNQLGYRIYSEGDGEDNRIDGMMPPLQMNNKGQVIIVPGEVYCRWENENGRLCRKNTRYRYERGLHAHYRFVHNVEPEPRTIGGFTYAYHMELIRWYHSVMLGERPEWIPRKPPRAAPAVTANSDDSPPFTSEWPSPKQGSPAPEQQSPSPEQQSPSPEQQSPAPEQWPNLRSP